jgi:anaerobic selenocysteine-containing dehydrogenase
MLHTTCLICRGLCGIEVEVENGKIGQVAGDKDHPISRGDICPKGRALPELVDLSSRYPKPLKKNGKDTFEEIEWADAVDLFTERLKAVRSTYGAETVALHVGQAGSHF